MPRLDHYSQELTPGEKRLAVFLVGGLTNQQIAARRGVSIKSVYSLMTRFYDKLSGMDGLEIPDNAYQAEIRLIVIEFLKTHTHLYENVLNRD